MLAFPCKLKSEGACTLQDLASLNLTLASGLRLGGFLQSFCFA